MKSIDHNHIEVVGTMPYGSLSTYITAYGTFYTGEIHVKRLSGTVDRLPVTIPKAVYDMAAKPLGEMLKLTGEIRTYNKQVDGTGRLFVGMFVRKIEDAAGAPEDENKVHLTGTICRPPIYRLTPFGREICDFMIAVKHPYGRSFYIPCIAWGLLAMDVSTWAVGDVVELTGRFQSRDYTKKHDDGREETRTAYEVSVMTIYKEGGATDDEQQQPDTMQPCP